MPSLSMLLVATAIMISAVLALRVLVWWLARD